MEPRRLLIIHTAFIGDVILALPMAQVLKRRLPECHITFVAVPASAPVLAHPAIDAVVIYDKRGKDRGLAGFLRLTRQIRAGQYDLALVPHRSLRSALLAWLANIPRRVGFTTSAGRFLFTDRVPYEPQSHEIVRDLRLLRPLDIEGEDQEVPRLFPNETERAAVDTVVREHIQQAPDFRHANCVALAPGSIWATKRWPAERFASLARLLLENGFSVALVGGEADRMLCASIAALVGESRLLNAAGTLSLLGSAEFVRRCRALVTNDSAPMHLASGVGTPVVAIYGATIPEFGFAPRGAHDRVLETNGLPCRPCGIHGGDACPVKTFACMLSITPHQVFEAVHQVIEATPTRAYGGDSQS